jgi:hypothetical protein
LRHEIKIGAADLSFQLFEHVGTTKYIKHTKIGSPRNTLNTRKSGVELHRAVQAPMTQCLLFLLTMSLMQFPLSCGSSISWLKKSEMDHEIH